MKTRYIFSGPLMMIATHLIILRVDIADSAPKLVFALLTFLSCLCTLFSIRWFMDMVWAVKELDEKVKEQEKKIEKLTDATKNLKLTQDIIRCKLSEVEDESRRAF